MNTAITILLMVSVLSLLTAAYLIWKQRLLHNETHGLFRFILCAATGSIFLLITAVTVDGYHFIPHMSFL